MLEKCEKKSVGTTPHWNNIEPGVGGVSTHFSGTDCSQEASNIQQLFSTPPEEKNTWQNGPTPHLLGALLPESAGKPAGSSAISPRGRSHSRRWCLRGWGRLTADEEKRESDSWRFSGRTQDWRNTARNSREVLLIWQRRGKKLSKKVWVQLFDHNESWGYYKKGGSHFMWEREIEQDWPFHSQVQKVHSPNLPKEKCRYEVVRIGSIIIFRLSKLWKIKFFILCDVIFLVRLQEKFEIDHSWKWKDKLKN